MKARRKVVASASSRRTQLTLTQRVERLERQYFAEQASAKGARYVVEGETVRDATTGLTWSRENIGGKRLTWADAKAACEALKIGGHSDWRLPTVQELLTLVDYSRINPAIDVDAFRCEAHWYWTSTPYGGSPAVYAWVVGFSSGYSCWNGQDCEIHVRAVRAGQ